MIPRGSNRGSTRRGSHVIDSLRNGALGISRLAPFASRDFRHNDRDNIDEEEGDNRSDKSESAMSMSSSSDNDDGMENGDSKRRQSRNGGGLTQSMAKMNQDGDKAARRSKYIMMGVLLVIGIVVLTVTAVMVNREDYQEFVNGFENLALELLFRVNVQTSTMEATFRGISSGVSGYATQFNATWPYVTMPSWPARALNTVQLTHAVVLGFSPFVNGSDIPQWERYSERNSKVWMDAAVPFQQQMIRLVSAINGGSPLQQAVSPEADFIAPFTSNEVYHYSQDGSKISVPPETPQVVPVWQLAPAPLFNASLVNFDMLNNTVLAHSLERLLQTGQTVLTPAFPGIELFWKGALPPSSSSDIDIQQPFSMFLQPIFAEVAAQTTTVVTSDGRQEDATTIQPALVGVLQGVVPWQVCMERAVANPDIRGINVVLDWIPDAACTGLSTPQPTDDQIYPTFTYRVDGKEASFVGYGDLHETEYDGMVETMDFIVPTNHRNSQPPNMTCAFGHYRFSVYPTRELQETNFNPSNAQAWLYSFAVVIIFCVATMIFLSYDYLVQLRQKAVMDMAIRSNAIVTNLFPSNVRDRIMKEAEEQAQAEYEDLKRVQKANSRRRLRRKRKNDEAHTAESATPIVAKNKLKDFLNEGDSKTSKTGGQGEGGNGDEQENIKYGSKPIADLFPAATVLFADIVGFTAWSSVREPTQVFQLLETLYHHFDEIANRRRVFKVETIGDCYVAVTGLPDPRPDHAIVMARFARDILTKMKDLCQRLELILGPDTGDLCLRIGLHSGAVTAGVLRGEKSRFQLFGDTVNTAARMESNGAPNKIHMSQDTARLLQEAGKKWAKKRADLVEAKGKGKMQTYWLQIGHDVRSRLSASVHLVDVPDIDATVSNTSHRNLMMPSNVETRSQLNLAKNMASARKNSLNHLNDSPISQKNGFNVKGSGNDDVGVGVGVGVLHDSSSRRASFAGSAPAKVSKRQVAVNSKKTARLVRWNAEVLSRLLKQIIARRKAVNALGRNEVEEDQISADGGTDDTKPTTVPSDADTSDDCSDSSGDHDGQRTILEEVKESIHLPPFDAEAARNQEDPFNIQLDGEVKDQLLAYVAEVASMYRYNPFHNFEHASHVTMSVVKLLSRIVAPDAVVDLASSGHQLVKNMHDHTFGITSDPLTQFAVVLSALIHDLDHPGVPNTTLVKERTSLAALYKNKSVAEQNSVDLAWEVLMDDRYKELRSAIFATKAEKKRFRQLIVNVVMATDIMDKDLKALRNTRWDKAFSKEEKDDDVNRKATIVIEHLIQASDVAHTMQHWHIYRKWNERFFEEMYNAYLEGRAENDPAEFWYKGEIGFFDFYIIPLAKKLKECGVFGVSSDEYLSYAETNRKEWEMKGEEVVKLYVAKFGRKRGKDDAADDTETTTEQSPDL